MTDSRTTGAGRSASQTLSRGIQILEVLAETHGTLTIDELARRLDVHRSIVYRLLRTLEDHRLVVRDESGRAALGPRMTALAAGVSQDLQSAALPELTAVANNLGMTCFLVVLDAEECITLASVMPRHTVASVAQRPGARHPVTAGAPGRAILSLLPLAEWPADVSPQLRSQVEEVGTHGFATSADEVIPNVQSVAVPLQVMGQSPAAIAVVHISGAHYPETSAAELTRAAAAIRTALGG